MSAVARRYARALFSLAADEGVVEAIGDELRELVDAFSEEPLATFAGATIDSESRRSAAVKVAVHLRLSPLLSRFLGVVAEKNRLGVLGEIGEQYRRFLDESLGRVRARITSAHPLGEEDRRRVLEAFERSTGKKVLAEAATDPDLLGGIVVEIGGRVYDGSVRTQLEAMQKALAG